MRPFRKKQQQTDAEKNYASGGGENIVRKGERCTESSAQRKDWLFRSAWKNLIKSWTFKVSGTVFSLITNGECWLSSSDITTLVAGKSHPKATAILGKAIKFRKTVNVMILQIFISFYLNQMRFLLFFLLITQSELVRLYIF